MILYIIYNADLLEITDNSKEEAVGYVDDVALMAIGVDFEETSKRLENMMTRERGGLEWSRDHNSKFEVSKSVVMHLTRRTQENPEEDKGRIPLDRPPLMILGEVIKEVKTFKYLGVVVDSNLRWNAQAQRGINATKWILQFRRLTKPSTGVNAKLMRQLYLSVAIPKMTYGLDV